jgi:hypothetical protein
MGVIMKLLHTKIIMGLIIATGMGLLPIQLDASSPYPHVSTSLEVATILDRLVSHIEQAQGTEGQALDAANAADNHEVPTSATSLLRYHLPARPTKKSLRDIMLDRDSQLVKSINFLPCMIIAPIMMRLLVLTITNSMALVDLKYLMIELFSDEKTRTPLLAEYFQETSLPNDLSSSSSQFNKLIPFRAIVVMFLITLPLIYNLVTRCIAALLKDQQRPPHYLQIPQTAEILTTTCSICTENLLSTENQLPLLATNCNTPHVHIFHQVCLNEWLVDNTSCPACRARVPDPGLVTITNPDSQPTAAVDHAHAD